MESSTLRGPSSEQTVDSINLAEPPHKNRIEMYSAILALLVVAIYAFILSTFGYSSYFLLIIVVLLIPGVLLHETFPYVFQWVFSGKKPYMGFKLPFPYSALAQGARVTRNQAIFCALAPFLFVTIILVLPSVFLSSPTKLILQAWAFIEVATCFGDFYLIKWLLKHPSDTKLGNVNLINTLFRYS